MYKWKQRTEAAKIVSQPWKQSGLFCCDQGAGQKAKLTEDTFEDLLGKQGFSGFGKRDTGPKTMAELRREELAKDMDPVKLMVRPLLCLLGAQVEHCS